MLLFGLASWKRCRKAAEGKYYKCGGNAEFSMHAAVPVDAGDGRRRRQWPDLVLSEDTSCLLLP